MKHILFCAVKEDLLAVLQMVETIGPLKYLRTGNFLRAVVEDGIDIFNSGAEIPSLGKATAESSHACDTYLVYGQETSINFRHFQGVGGVERVCIDQLVNPDTVTFTPGGIWDSETILEGRIATASESQTSQGLMKRFHGPVRNIFTKIKAFYVGPKALELMKQGARLTMAVQSPPEFDLTNR